MSRLDDEGAAQNKEPRALEWFSSVMGARSTVFLRKKQGETGDLSGDLSSYLLTFEERIEV